MVRAWKKKEMRSVKGRGSSQWRFKLESSERVRHSATLTTMTTASAPTSWVPLEANPDLFSTWCETLGLDTSKYAFYDVFGLDDELLAMVPQPVEAVLFLFPLTPRIEAHRSGLQKKADEKSELLWFPQTIGNACGTIGLLHAIANSAAAQAIRPESVLAHLLARARSVPPAERANLLLQCEDLRSAHASTAAQGQTAAPTAEDDVDLHFVAFARSSTGALVELDGRQDGPVERVPYIERNELLSRTAHVIQQHYMAVDPDQVQFSIVALSQSV